MARERIVESGVKAHAITRQTRMPDILGWLVAVRDVLAAGVRHGISRTQNTLLESFGAPGPVRPQSSAPILDFMRIGQRFRALLRARLAHSDSRAARKRNSDP